MPLTYIDLASFLVTIVVRDLTLQRGMDLCGYVFEDELDHIGHLVLCRGNQAFERESRLLELFRAVVLDHLCDDRGEIQQRRQRRKNIAFDVFDVID